jgi:hypothetical protein
LAKPLHDAFWIQRTPSHYFHPICPSQGSGAEGPRCSSASSCKTFRRALLTPRALAPNCRQRAPRELLQRFAIPHERMPIERACVRA